MNVSDLVARAARLAVQQVVARAEQLGLGVVLRPATCTAEQARVATRVRMDGDTAVLPAISLIGPVPPAARVMTLSAAGAVYVLGWFGLPPAGCGCVEQEAGS